MRIFLFTFALVSIFSIIYAKPQPEDLPNPSEDAKNVANQIGQIPHEMVDLGLSQMEEALAQAKEAAQSPENSGLLHNFVPRIDKAVNEVRNLAKILTLGISEIAFKHLLGLPSSV